MNKEKHLDWAQDNVKSSLSVLSQFVHKFYAVFRFFAVWDVPAAKLQDGEISTVKKNDLSWRSATILFKMPQFEELKGFP